MHLTPVVFFELECTQLHSLLRTATSYMLMTVLLGYKAKRDQFIRRGQSGVSISKN